MKYSCHISKKAITITWSDGTTTAITPDNPSYDKAMGLIKAKRSEESLRAIIDPLRVVAEWSGGKVILRGKTPFCVTPAGTLPVNPKLAAFLQEFVDNNWPAEAFCRFVYRLSQNPSQRSVETFYEFVVNYGLTITDDGLVRGYKAITNNWMDKHTQTVSNRIGDKPQMARSKVDDNPDVGCSVGFHCGCLDYVKGFAYNFGSPTGDRIVLVEFDPTDVVCVPRDCGCGKIRCSTYTVVAEYAGELASYAGAGLKADQDVRKEQEREALQQAIAAADKPKPVRSVICPVCGEKLKKDQKYCSECGSSLTWL